MEVKDKIATVTGASSGIGLATARLLAARGAKVALVARSADKLEALSRELPGSFVAPADMTVEEDVRTMAARMLEHYRRVDILVNCAGRGYDAPVEHIDLDTFRDIFQLDVVGPLVAMQAVIPIMRRQGGGTIVNVSSGTSLMNLPNMSPYSSLKRALNALSLAAREELKRDNIVVSVVYPYMTATDFEENTIKDSHIQWEEEDEGDLPPLDPPEHVAQKILEAIETEAPEVYAHDWMKGPR
ncbi:MAG: SDR family oxidoreductase [Dehalococcoidia bacterium]|nr:SDR family oxidoreductase [Dehalococcoidia bacterium]